MISVARLIYIPGESGRLADRVRRGMLLGGCRFSLVRRSFGRLVARSTALRAVLPGELSPSADGDRCRYRSLVPVAIC
jgi:hypothetical protein